jgi:hypothetical protein
MAVEVGDASADGSRLVHARAIRANEIATIDARLGAWTARRIAGERTRPAFAAHETGSRA